MAKRPLKVPERSEIQEDTPLRLEVAASGLRRERDAGRLATFFVAGTEFTTLKDMAYMVATCRGRSPSSVARGSGQAAPARMGRNFCGASMHASRLETS